MAFPIPETPPQPTISWNGSLGRFIDTTTGRIVPNLAGIETLSVGRPFGRPGFVDAFGKPVPSPVNLIPKSFEIPFANQLRNASATSADVYTARAPENQYYLTMATFTDDNGRVRMTLVASKGGQPINIEDEARRLAGAIANELGTPMGAEGSKRLFERVTTILHFTVG